MAKKIYISLHDPTSAGNCSNVKSNVFNILISKYGNNIITTNIPLGNNCTYFFLKHEKNTRYLRELKKRNNYIIYEPLDSKWNSSKNIKEYMANMKDYLAFFDKIVCQSDFMKEEYSKYIDPTKLVTIYHEFDSRFKCTNKITNDILYIGLITKQNIPENIWKKYSVNTTYNKYQDFYKRDISIHIDFITNTNLYYYLHTSTKLSTALCLGCVFICNRIPIYVELLGKNYEYFINDDLSNIDEVITNAKNTLNNNSLYSEYIKKYEPVKKQLSPDKIASRYHKLLNNK